MRATTVAAKGGGLQHLVLVDASSDVNGIGGGGKLDESGFGLPTDVSEQF